MAGKSNAEINERLAASGPATRSKVGGGEKRSFGEDLDVDDGLTFAEGEERWEEADERSTRLDRGVQGEKQIDAGEEGR
jgi:hypothetical protein